MSAVCTMVVYFTLNYLNDENDQLDDSLLNWDKKMYDENKVTDKLHLLK
jgi:hypothetical protein